MHFICAVDRWSAFLAAMEDGKCDDDGSDEVKWDGGPQF